MDNNKMEINFQEKQKFSQWWMWLLLISVAIIPIYGIYKQIIKDEMFGDSPMSNGGLIIFTICILGVIYFFWYITLNTKMDEHGIKIHFKPFNKRHINWTEIKSAEIVTYGFVGYGIRFGSKYGVIYNIKGNKGVAIELKNGEKLLIGTQQENKLNSVLESVRGNNIM